jgi:hypothetical protein
MIIFTPNVVIKSADVNANFDEVTTNITNTFADAWYQELAVTTLSGASDTISATFTPKNYLRILVSTVAAGSTIRSVISFNNDSGTNYQQYLGENGGAMSGTASLTYIFLTASTTAYGEWAIIEGFNFATRDKIFRLEGNTVAQTGLAPGNVREGILKWSNTSTQISTVTITNTSTSDFAANSQLIVLGHD